MKTLRFLLMGMFMLVCGSASAQEVVIDFSGDTDNWGIGTEKVTESKSYTYDGLTIKLTPAGSGNYFRWYTSGNILLGKQGATLELPAFDFDVERIDIEGTSGASAAVKQNIYVGDEAVSTETTGAKDVTNMYLIAEDKQAAGTIYTLKVTSSHNTQITKILIYKKGSNVKQQAGLSWGKASFTVTLGDDNYELPLLSNPNELTVRYDSSDPSVATIDENGRITIIAVGKTDISAIFEGDDTYEAQTAKYQLIVKDQGGDTPDQPAEIITVAKALEIINTLEDGKTTSDTYQVKGFIVGRPDFQHKTDGTLYGNVNLTIADEKNGTDLLTVFRAKNIGNVNFTEETINLMEGDEVVFEGKLQKYVKNDVMTPELTSGYLISVNASSSNINTVKTSRLQGTIYNLAGQRVKTVGRGLYIINGRKVIVK